jgi:3'-phosphoadenosine 5'-phosphosulfate sulfotransferase (PAPS reductase)/FAD synthetase
MSAADPFFITGPALISFSGGRTSAYMLWRILQAHGGTLPDDVVVAFANTGKEREETLRFVHEVGVRWGVAIHWLEWRPGDLFEEVGLNSAARNGEPFEALISAKHTIPNSFMRFCTEDLKVTVMRGFVRSLGWDRCANPVGLRADETKRVLKQLARNEDPKRLWDVSCPLHAAGINRDDVMEFWSEQPFDLGLHPYEGNCDLCFMKGERILERLIRDDPTRAEWWIAQEQRIGFNFKKGRRSYAEMAEHVRRSPLLPIIDADEEHDAECGTWCAGEAA